MEGAKLALGFPGGNVPPGEEFFIVDVDENFVVDAEGNFLVGIGVN